jgi:hypothetical protein
MDKENLLYLHKGTLSAVKNNEILSLAATSETSQTQEEKYHTSSFMDGNNNQSIKAWNGIRMGMVWGRRPKKLGRTFRHREGCWGREGEGHLSRRKVE